MASPSLDLTDCTRIDGHLAEVECPRAKSWIHGSVKFLMLQRDGLQYSCHLYHDRGASTVRCKNLSADRQRPTVNWIETCCQCHGTRDPGPMPERYLELLILISSRIPQLTVVQLSISHPAATVLFLNGRGIISCSVHRLFLSRFTLPISHYTSSY